MTVAALLQQAEQALASGSGTQAVALAERAAALGSAQACYRLAAWNLIGQPVSRDVPRARAFLRRAVAIGHVDAALMEVALTANGSGAPPDWAAALGLLRAAARNDPVAAAQLALVDAMALGPDGEPITVPAGEILAKAPHVARFSGFATPAECAHIAMAAQDVLEPATVFDPATGRQIAHPIRTSHGGAIGPTRETLVVQAINRRIAAISGTAAACGEPLTVLRYQPGQQYRLHLDAIGRTDNDRSHTVLLYLNDGFVGGATQFPQLGLTVAPKAGDALLFANLLPDGKPDQRARHAGLPVASGTKWLATRWIRQRPLDLWQVG